MTTLSMTRIGVVKKNMSLIEKREGKNRRRENKTLKSRENFRRMNITSMSMMRKLIESN